MVYYWRKVYLNVAILVIKHSIWVLKSCIWTVLLVAPQCSATQLKGSKFKWGLIGLVPAAQCPRPHRDGIWFNLNCAHCAAPAQARPQPPAKTGTKDKYLKSCSIAELRLVVVRSLEVTTKVPEDFTIKAPNRSFSWLKVPTSTFTFNTSIRHYAKWAPKCLLTMIRRPFSIVPW